MTASQVFQIVNPLALLGWLILAASVVTGRSPWRDGLIGRWWPVGFSALYAVLIACFFWKAPGGFDSLANVQLLFTSEWAALAGWIHYLAFDLYVGSRIAREVMERGLPRFLLLVLLPLTFMFGPIGLVGLEVSRLLFERRPALSTL